MHVIYSVLLEMRGVKLNRCSLQVSSEACRTTDNVPGTYRHVPFICDPCSYIDGLSLISLL